MAFELNGKIKEADTNEAIRLYDTAGVYNPVNNTTGYGSPNITIGDIDTATLTVRLPGETTSLDPIDVKDVDIPFPNTDDAYIEITNEDLGLAADAKIPDGVYKFVYEISGNTPSAFTYTKTFYKAIVGQITCCLDNRQLALPIPDCTCDCTTDSTCDLSNLRSLVAAACSAADCGKAQRAEEIIDYLQSVCDCEDNEPLKLC